MVQAAVCQALPNLVLFDSHWAVQYDSSRLAEMHPLSCTGGVQHCQPQHAAVQVKSTHENADVHAVSLFGMPGVCLAAHRLKCWMSAQHAADATSTDESHLDAQRRRTSGDYAGALACK